MVLLTVTGRVTGAPRSTPVAVTPNDGGWTLTAAYGVGDWVKNLRAAGDATLTARGRRIRVRAFEIPPTHAAPRLRRILADAGRTTRRIIAPYYTTPVDASLQAWEAEAARHPMFRLEPVDDADSHPSRILRALVGLLIAGITIQVFLAGIAALDDATVWHWHRTFGVVVEAIALTAAITALATRQVGARWLTISIFILITFQHGTAAIGSGVAAGMHPVNALVMLTVALVIRRRLHQAAARHRPRAALDASSAV
jgi:deazaflavin-dependent oxidoreductase (nitroreductase family)